jgi:hypothetical protein
MYLKFYSTDGVSQALRDFSVAEAAGDQISDLSLAFGQKQTFVRCRHIAPHPFTNKTL